MLGKAFRLLLAGFALTAGCALAQGTFAHITYGAGWQTTFTFVNLSSTDTANLSLFFYNEDGTTLAAPVQGGPTGSPYNFSIAPSGATTIVLLGQSAVDRRNAGARPGCLPPPRSEESAGLRSRRADDLIGLAGLHRSLPAFVKSGDHAAL